MLSTLMSSNNKYLVEGSVSALVRGKDKEAILERKGYRPVLFEDLDSTDQLTHIASHFDGMNVHTLCYVQLLALILWFSNHRLYPWLS